MIRAINLCMRFGKRLVWQDVSAEFTSSTVTCLLGRNGTGKTTLLRCLATLIVPVSGEIIWFNQFRWSSAAGLWTNYINIQHARSEIFYLEGW
ncbi:ATP-binding cassette domain-containing protein [Hydrogenibacillus sp. N12]|uniref:ATP-binding cassette domain-containing protein n=1 Tax=Hydrogenibacillus sp. N12 TaxID=2866627 RepID=UPI001C7CE92E|nr:ATP-binding cassette domain-containing protein [Hydrogenibacillus sp. N12]